MWDWHAANGKISWDSSSFTVINANNTFCRHFEKADSFIRSECEKRNIGVEEGWTLVEVQKVIFSFILGQKSCYLQKLKDWINQIKTLWKLLLIDAIHLSFSSF